MTHARRPTVARARGFTLVELMTVVTIIAVLAAIAVLSLRRSHSAGDADAWANQIRNTVTFLRRRAGTTGTPYALELGATSLKWCQIPPASCATDTAPTCATAANCTGPNTTCEKSSTPIDAGTDAMTDSWANTADILFSYTGNAVAYSPPAHTAISGSSVQPIYFGSVGSVDSKCSNVMTNPPVPSSVPGITIYVRASNVVANPTSEGQKRRRVVIYGVTGRPRIIDNW